MSAHRWQRGDDFPIRDAEGLDATTDADLPRVLLGDGERPDAFATPRIAIVGTRAATPLGLADAREIGAFCARAGITVISGLALGIDAAAHEGALDAGGLTVGVVATGLDVVYPRRHERLYARVRTQGLIVTEHPPGTQPLPWRFPIRNRIIAALADDPDGRYRRGRMLTAEGRDGRYQPWVGAPFCGTVRITTSGYPKGGPTPPARSIESFLTEEGEPDGLLPLPLVRRLHGLPQRYAAGPTLLLRRLRRAACSASSNQGCSTI